MAFLLVAKSVPQPRPRATVPPTAFTLIELLVVVTIIVVLLSLLTPALDKAIDMAERAQCAGRLHAWGVAIPQYSLDHRSKVLSTLRNQGNTDVYPSLVWGDNGSRPGFDNTFARRKGEDFSAESMEPYIQNGDFKARQYGKMWYCPANRSDRKEFQNNTGQVDHPLGGWFAMDWGYFAQPNMWPGHATKPRELTGSRLGGGKLIMADVLYFFNPGGAATWWFNHSETGWSVHGAGWGGPVQGRESIRGITGTNQLFNDSSVYWKGREKFDPEAVLAPQDTEGWVSSATSNGQPHPGGNLNFW